jgi:hypothetical protein
MAHKGQKAVSVEMFLAVARQAGCSIEMKSYIIISNPKESGKQILVEKYSPKGATEIKARWVELRGAGKVPYNSATEGVVAHDHNSPSIKFRLDIDSVDEEGLKRNFSSLVNNLMGIKPAQQELPLSPPAEEAQAA